LVWKNEAKRQMDDGDDEDEDDGMESFGDRMFGFTVEQTNEEEEGATEEEGFIVSKIKVSLMAPTHIQADSTRLHQPSHSAS